MVRNRTITIDASTFVATGTNQFGNELGTVEVNGETRKAVRDSYYSGHSVIYVHGYVGRYRTGTRTWPVHLSLHNDGRVHAWFGRDDRCGNFQKLDGVSYAPEVFDTLTNASYWTAV